MRPSYPVTELLGDGIGAELSRSIHTLADALPIQLDFRAVDLTLTNRRAQGKTIYDEAVEAVMASKVALKYPTVTAEESPNAVLRRRLDLSVIHRPVYTIPGVPTNFRRELDFDIVRIATGGTYDDPGRAIGDDSAVSLRIVEGRPVRQAARYAFELARKTGKRVTSASKYTIQKATDGLFESITKQVAVQYPEVPHNVELFDALLGKVIMTPEKFQIMLVLNEYGDFLSDMACGLAGSLGIGASANLAFDASGDVKVALYDAAHGTAPDIQGKNLANPTAIFLAFALMLYQLGEVNLGHTVKTTTLDLLREGVRTKDLGGIESTDSFTEAVAAEVSKRVATEA
jgi:isocitrate dehydrogenase (NAD+)